MKKYVSPVAEFIEFKVNDIMTQSGGECTENYVCPQDAGCPKYVCPSMYGEACAGNPYN